MSQPAVSRHLATLQNAGLITHRRSGTRRIFRLEAHRLADLDAWLEDFRVAMEANYARLDALLAETPPERTDPDAP
jgi:DNA-binding transcriptional ArsR family regulator